MCDINIYGIGNLYVYEIANWKKESGALFTDSCDLEMPVVRFSLTVAIWKEASGALFTDSCDLEMPVVGFSLTKSCHLEMPVVRFSLTNSHTKHNQIRDLEMVSMQVSLIVII